MVLATPAAQALTDQAALHSTDLPWNQSVTYAGTPIDAEFEYGSQWDPETDSVMSTVTIWAQKADVAEPDYRDVVTVEGRTWYVRKWESGDSANWEILLYNERPVI